MTLEYGPPFTKEIPVTLQHSDVPKTQLTIEGDVFFEMAVSYKERGNGRSPFRGKGIFARARDVWMKRYTD